jgi:hypothetical protein
MPRNKSLTPPNGKSGTGIGSGVMIGDGVMLTAGHVMYEFNEETLPENRDIRTLSGATLFWDPRGYLPAYIDIFDAFPITLPIVIDPDQTISRLFIEPKVTTKDIVFVNFGGDVGSRDAGLVTYLTSSDITTQDFGLIIGTKYKWWGATTGEKEVREGFLALGSVGLTITDPQAITQPGDSGGGNWIEFEGREFIVGNNVASNLSTRSLSSYITTSEFNQINQLLSQSQTGNVTQSEPTNLIVGSSGNDGGINAPVEGSYRADIILGRGGNDVLSDGDAVGDLAYADDQIFGGAGDDKIIIGDGNNLIHGGDFRAYGGTARIALEVDGVDTADFRGVSNGIEIRIAAPISGGATTTIVDTRYKAVVGDEDTPTLCIPRIPFAEPVAVMQTCYRTDSAAGVMAYG